MYNSLLYLTHKIIKIINDQMLKMQSAPLIYNFVAVYTTKSNPS